MKLKYSKLCGEINSKEIIEIGNHVLSLSSDEFKQLLKRGNIIFINGAFLIIGVGYLIDKIYLNHKKEIKEMEATPENI